MGVKHVSLIVCLLILTGTTWFFIDRHNATRYQTVGDELLDRYAVQFLADLQSELANPTDPTLSTGMPDRYDKRSAMLLDSWEAEYSDDPRYWQLRAQVAPVGGEYHLYMRPDDSLRVTKLPELIEGGMTDEGIFALVSYRQMFKSDRTRALNLVHQAVKLYPDNAHFHYLQAALKLKAGRVTAAFDALASGNAAPRNDPPAIYPQSFAITNPDLFAASRLNRTFYMTRLDHLSYGTYTDTYILEKEFVRLAVEEYPDSLSPAQLDMLLARIHRYCTRSDKSLVRAKSGLAMFSQVLESEQVNALAVQAGQSSQCMSLLGAVGSAYSDIEKRMTAKLDDGEVSRVLGVENWDREYENLAEDQRFLETGIYPLLAPLDQPVFTLWAQDAGLDPAVPVE